MPTGSTAYANWVNSVCKRVEKICQLYVYVCVHTHKKTSSKCRGRFSRKNGSFLSRVFKGFRVEKVCQIRKNILLFIPELSFYRLSVVFRLFGGFLLYRSLRFWGFFVNIRVKKVCQSIKKHNFFHKKRTGKTRHFTQNARVCLLPFYRLSVLYQRAAKPQRSENEAREKSQQNLTLSLAFTSIDIYR